jgi:sensor histidine kinase regulating citrate/malate metabolism
MRYGNHGVDLRVKEVPADLELECRAAQISQILFNLLNNAHDAIVHQEGNKWIELSVSDCGDEIEFAVSDSGHGFSHELFQESLKKGSGITLVNGLVASHHGQFHFDETSQFTRIVVRLPKIHPGNASRRAA